MIPTQLEQRIFRAVYQLLGSSLSTRLSQTGPGKKVLRYLSKNKRNLDIYCGINNLKLQLTRKEAEELGFIYLGLINPNETALIGHILSEGDVFIDVGAYVDAWHSLVASKMVGGHGKVYIFEPIFYRRLENNLKINKLHNVTLNKVAVSDKNGYSFLYKNNEASSLISHQIKNHLPKIKVKTTKLDTYVSQNKIKKIKLIKIDVEGAEMKVLKGSKKILNKKNSPDLLVEVVDNLLKDAGNNRVKTISFLKKLGYKVYTITGNGNLQAYKTKENQKINNLFFSKKKY